MVISLDEEKEAILEHIKTCPRCGVDLEMWRKMVHEEHHCEILLPEPKVRKCYLIGSCRRTTRYGRKEVTN